MAIQLENILTMSAGDYVESIGKRLSDYRAVGVFAQRSSIDLNYKGAGDFLRFVPENAEAVVDFNFGERLVYGTALIPKKAGEQ